MKQVLRSPWAGILMVSILSAQEPQLQNTIAAHKTPVLCVAFSPDGRVLASGTLREAKLWDVATGKKRATLDDAGLVRFVQFSSDGRKLALSTAQGEQGVITLWDTATLKNTATLHTYNAGSFMVINAAGTTLLWSDDRTMAPDRKKRMQACHVTIKLWDIATGESTPICSICKSEERLRMVVALAFSADQELVAARDNEGVIEIWNMAVGKKARSLSDVVEMGAFSIAFSPTGMTLASAGSNKTIKLWDIATGTNTTILRGHNAEVFAVAYSPDGKILASCGYERTIKLWDVGTGKNIANLNTSSKAINSVTFSANGKTLASAGYDGTIGLWDVGTEKMEQKREQSRIGAEKAVKRKEQAEIRSGKR